jgi:glycosyltransferase 2 family protein
LSKNKLVAISIALKQSLFHLSTMNLPKNLLPRSFAVIAFSIALYAGVVFFVDGAAFKNELSGFPIEYMGLLIVLSLANYLLRFWRWQIYLKDLGHPLPPKLSFGLYFLTYIMVITPGKIGEVFKAGILKDRFDVPLSVGLPIVLAERIYDFLGVLILAALGTFFWPGPLTGMTSGLLVAASIPFFLILFQNKKIRSRLLKKVSSAKLLSKHKVGLDESMDAFSKLLGIKQAVFSLVLTTFAWFLECIELWVACMAFGKVITVAESVFVYAAGTLVGSLMFMPGGLGGTEGTIIYLLKTLEYSGATAAAVALVVRLATLWLAVVVGLVAYLAFRKSLLDPDQ